MKIFLTGATGFIGSHVARKLVDEDCEVYALIRPNSDTWRIKDLIHSLNIVNCDFLSKKEMSAQLRSVNPDLCIHLAWCPASGRNMNGLENVRFLSSSLDLAMELASLGCKRFIGVGTCAEYAPMNIPLSESSPSAPDHLYGVSKNVLFRTLQQLGRVTGMELAWLRPFYLYGPYEDQTRLVPSIICSLLKGEKARVTKGDQVKDFLHVEDAAEAIWTVAKTHLKGPFNVGFGKTYSVREIVSMISNVLNSPELIEFGTLPCAEFDPIFMCADISRLRQSTSWSPRYDLSEGLKNTIGWWKSQSEPSSVGTNYIRKSQGLSKEKSKSNFD